MNTRTFQWLSVAIIGLVHLYMVPQEYGEVAYMGVLFGINFIAAIIAAVGIYRQENWGWLLGVGIAIGSLIGYILSRTVGLPGMEIEAWLQPIGVLSLVVELAFIMLVMVKKPWVGVQIRAR
jgi:threonine/homoserine efflux transporter RhtA